MRLFVGVMGFLLCFAHSSNVQVVGFMLVAAAVFGNWGEEEK